MIGKTLHASLMRFRITLQSPVTSDDNTGGMSRSWQDEAQVWAQALPVNVGDSLQAGQVHSNLRMRIMIRTRSNINESWRIVFAGRTYRIATLLREIKAKGMMEIIAEEVISG